ncbi:hypothetical protein CRX72_24360 [Pantoea sp. BRM17]|nr:hypothetical protein CRX72_24360 [Pantoea sp. BRM17]
MAIYGAGTGLGVSHLVHVNQRWVSLPGEGGHVDKTFSTSDYDNLEAVIRFYLAEQQQAVTDGCIAIACPITEDWVEMTNHDWAFSTRQMKQNLGFSTLEHHTGLTASASPAGVVVLLAGFYSVCHYL